MDILHRPDWAAIVVAAGLLTFSVPSVQALSKPHIYFMGRDVTGKTQHIAVGELISLTTSPPPIPGQQQQWAVTGGPDPIQKADFTEPCPLSPDQAPIQCDVFGAVDSSEPSIDFHLIRGRTYGVGYSYSVGDETASSSTAFVVDAPTDVKLSASESAAQIVVKGSRYFLSFGNFSEGPPGIAFAVSANEPHPGKFYWLQNIYAANHGFIKNDKSVQCVTLSGLDTEYPYDEGPTVNDAPHLEITGDSFASDAIQADMFVFWQSNLPDSIPVPIGDVYWDIQMNDTYSKGVWQAPVYSTTEPIISYHSAYPIWYSIASQKSPCHANR